MEQSKVYLTGSGLGRISDLTWKAKHLLETADVIFYDRLVNKNLLHLAKKDCDLVYVGKKPYGYQTPQESIEAQLVAAADRYKKIVRLKSGDPFVFGRGAEECEALEEAGIAFEIVPGLTSALAGLTYGGIPATARELSRNIHIFTAQSKDGPTEFSWEAISKMEGTLVFMMGIKELCNIANALMAAGKEPDTPVAVIEWASRAKQRQVRGNLQNISKIICENNIKSPCIIVIGQVVNYDDLLGFYANKPGFGQQVALPNTISDDLVMAVEDLGAEVLFYQTAEDEGTGKVVPMASFETCHLVLPDESALASAQKLFEPSQIISLAVDENILKAAESWIRDIPIKKISRQIDFEWLDAILQLRRN